MNQIDLPVAWNFRRAAGTIVTNKPESRDRVGRCEELTHPVCQGGESYVRMCVFVALNP